MQINNRFKLGFMTFKQNFKEDSANQNTQTNLLEKSESQNQKEGFFRKIFTRPSLTAIPTLPFVGVGIYAFFKELKIKKQIKNSIIKESRLKEFNKTMYRTGIASLLSAVPLYFVIDYINNKNKNKNFEKAKKQIEDFNKQNGASIKLIPQNRKPSFIDLASFDPITARISLTERVTGDIIYAKIKQKHLINHELVHAKQHILMACSENGISKMNYIIVKKLANKLNDEKKLEIYNEYQKIKTAKNMEYKGKTVKMNNYKINLVDYVTALYKVIYEKETNPDNIPIILNKEFYEKAKSTRGALTKEQEKKAQAYLEAYEEYPAKVGFIQAINPNSDYKQNLLEKEAFRAIPWYTSIIMNLLCFF